MTPLTNEQISLAIRRLAGLEEDDGAFTREQAAFCIKCMAQYRNVRKREGLRFPSSADIDHSCLLRRLLSGKPPLDKPPPKRYSCPDYALGEGKAVKVGEVWEGLSRLDFGQGETVLAHDQDGTEIAEDAFPIIIDQSRAWRWLDLDQGLLMHKNGDTYRFTPSQRQDQLVHGRWRRVQSGVLQKVTTTTSRAG